MFSLENENKTVKNSLPKVRHLVEWYFLSQWGQLDQLQPQNDDICFDVLIMFPQQLLQYLFLDHSPKVQFCMMKPEICNCKLQLQVPNTKSRCLNILLFVGLAFPTLFFLQNIIREAGITNYFITHNLSHWAGNIVS